MPTTLISSRNTFQPITVCRVPTGEILFANGLDQAQLWKKSEATLVNAGIPAAVKGTFAGSWGTAGAISGVFVFAVRYLDADGIPGDLSVVATATAASHSTISYTNVPVSSDPRVTQRQIFRGQAGVTNVLHLDATIADNVTTTANSTKTDAQLSVLLSLPILNPDGSVNARRFGVPPAHKAVVFESQDRTLWLVNVDYTKGHVEVTNGSATVTGRGTNWTSSMAGRYLHVVGSATAYLIDSINTTTQVITLSVVYAGTTDKFGPYTIRVDDSEESLVYWSSAGEPEAVYALNADNVLLNSTRSGKLTGGFVLGSMAFLMRERQIIRWTFLSDPAIDGAFFQAAERGCINQRCIAQFDNFVGLLDREGVYIFNGGTVDPATRAIQSYFRPGKIHWASEKWFHAQVYEAEETARFYICLSGSRYPRHAFCYHYRRQEWWVEEYPFEVSASCTAPVNGQLRLLVGGPHERVILAQEGTLDAISESLTARSKVAAATSLSVTVKAPAFSATDIVGSVVAIVAGPGKGQQRRILAADASTGRIDIDRPWLWLPTSASKVQIGGVAWRWKSGHLRYVATNKEHTRKLGITYDQTKHEGSIEFRYYLGHKTVPEKQAAAHDDYNGMTTEEKQPDVTFATARQRAVGESSGYNEHNWDDSLESGRLSADRFVQLELRGWQNQDPVVIHSMAVSGVQK